MKRSEIIDKMAEIMESKFDGNNSSWQKDAEAVLDYLENIGMLPPLEFSRYMSGQHRWEPENE